MIPDRLDVGLLSVCLRTDRLSADGMTDHIAADLGYTAAKMLHRQGKIIIHILLGDAPSGRRNPAKILKNLLCSLRAVAGSYDLQLTVPADHCHIQRALDFFQIAVKLSEYLSLQTLRDVNLTFGQRHKKASQYYIKISVSRQR